jgi:hypothetical protein
MPRAITYESLLITNRAVIRKGNWLRIMTAGEYPETYWLEFEDKATAKRAGLSVLIHIKKKRAKGKCNTDHMYNTLLSDWFDQLSKGGYIKNLKSEATANG